MALDTGHVDGAALAGMRRTGTAVLGMQRAYAQASRTAGQLFQHITDLHLTGMHGARHHGAHTVE